MPMKKTPEELISSYDTPVPRYTSFPTAVQFTADIPQSFYHKQLGVLLGDEPVSIYIHIPFCHSLCHYCGCHTKVVHNATPIENYIKSLLAEIDLAGQHLPNKIPVARVHFGGGSPNYAHSKEINKILDRLAKYFSFSNKTEIDIECDPRQLSSEKITDYGRLKVSRVSLGVQDFNVDVQQAVNRVQSFELIKEQVQLFRTANIKHINFDLMVGLPKQTLKTLEETFTKALSLQPSRIAVFPYAHVPWMKKHQKLLEAYPLPSPNLRFKMTELAHNVITKAGYKSIGMDHYALPTDSLAKAQKIGKLKRNFQGYTDDMAQTMIGFGVSAISQFDGVYIQNKTDSIAYRKDITENKNPIERGCILSEDDKIRRMLIEQLLCKFSVYLPDFPTIDVPKTKLEPLQEDGIVKLTPTDVIITELGKPFARIVAASFDPYLRVDKGTRHAKAI